MNLIADIKLNRIQRPLLELINIIIIDKFINMLPLTTTTPKHTNEELEMAEKMAAMIVQDVVNQNNHLN